MTALRLTLLLFLATLNVSLQAAAQAAEVTAIAQLREGEVSLLANEETLARVFEPTLRQLLGNSYFLVFSDGVPPPVAASATVTLTLETIAVEWLGADLPYLVLRGKRADGNCLLAAEPLSRVGDSLYLSADVEDIVAARSPADSSRCFYRHTCSGDTCSACTLTLSDDSCRGACACEGDEEGFCNHAVSTL